MIGLLYTENGNVDGRNDKLAGRKWTPEEERLLELQWGTVSVDTIAARLNRTINSIRKRRAALGLLGYLESGDYITVYKLLNTINGNTKSCRRHLVLKNAGLPVFYKKMRGKRGSVMAVRLDDFWTWLSNNPTLINLANLEENALGGEPEWVKRKRYIDWKYNFAPQKNIPFTPDDEAKIISLAKKYKYTYDEIALQIGRSAQSVKDKMYSMGLSIRLGYLKESKKWTNEEDRQLVSLIKDGFTIRGIAIKMRRGEETVRGRMNILWGSCAVNSLFHKIQRGEIAC